MKILIVGTGVIGTFIGAALQASGHDIWHLQRAGKKGSPSPVKLAFRDRRKTKQKAKEKYYRYELVDDSQIGDFPWILAPVGHTHVRAVAERLAPRLRPGQVVQWMGNVWRDYAWLTETLNPYLVFTFPHFGGSFVDGALRGWLLPNLSLSEGKGGGSDRCTRIRKIWEEAGFVPKLKEDMRGWLWTHFAWNAGIMGAAGEASGFKHLRWQWGGLKKAYVVARMGMAEAEEMGAEVRKFAEGRRAYQPLWWNALKTRALFLVPGIAGMVDRLDQRKWSEYAVEIWGKYPSDQELST